MWLKLFASVLPGGEFASSCYKFPSSGYRMSPPDKVVSFRLSDSKTHNIKPLDRANSSGV